MVAGIVLIRGGGDLSSGVAIRLYRIGIQVVILELGEPLVVRRKVAFAQAVFSGQTQVEGVKAQRVECVEDVLACLKERVIPVVVDPKADIRRELQPLILVDGRLTKRPPELGKEAAPLVIGLGPGFWAGKNCHAVIETQRGHRLGRVIWQGEAIPDSGIPEFVNKRSIERVLHAPASGVLKAHVEIGDRVQKGQVVAEVEGQAILAPFEGVLRGLVNPGMRVSQGLKVGDVDPRCDPSYCVLVSDKSLAIGGGVLEAALTLESIRKGLWETD